MILVSDARQCAVCGSDLDASGICKGCGLAPRRPSLRNEAGTLAVLTAIAIVFFAATSFAVGSYRAKEKQLAKDWYVRGERQLAAQPAQAVLAFQTALRYDPDEPQYRLGLVKALLSAGRSEQARSYLLSMWEQQPASGPVNLNLARIAASRGDITQSTRYYHNAIYGIWDDAAQPHREQARFELAEFLIARAAMREADAELVALAANTPRTPELAHRLGDLFLKAGDPDSALQQYREALKAAPHDAAVLAGAGRAAFAIGDYSQAEQYLGRAKAGGSSDQIAMQELDMCELIRSNDPLDHKAPWQTRAERAIGAVAQSSKRLEACAIQIASKSGAAPADVEQALQRLDGAERDATLKKLRQDPDLLLIVAREAFAGEVLAAKYCGPTQGIDEALLLIGHSHPEVTP